MIWALFFVFVFVFVANYIYSLYFKFVFLFGHRTLTHTSSGTIKSRNVSSSIPIPEHIRSEMSLCVWKCAYVRRLLVTVCVKIDEFKKKQTNRQANKLRDTQDEYTYVVPKWME